MLEECVGLLTMDSVEAIDRELPGNPRIGSEWRTEADRTGCVRGGAPVKRDEAADFLVMGRLGLVGDQDRNAPPRGSLGAPALIQPRDRGRTVRVEALSRLHRGRILSELLLPCCIFLQALLLRGGLWSR